jgi:hypothetical protein
MLVPLLPASDKVAADDNPALIVRDDYLERSRPQARAD